MFEVLEVERLPDRLERLLREPDLSRDSFLDCALDCDTRGSVCANGPKTLQFVTTFNDKLSEHIFAQCILFACNIDYTCTYERCYDHANVPSKGSSNISYGHLDWSFSL